MRSAGRATVLLGTWAFAGSAFVVGCGSGTPLNGDRGTLLACTWPAALDDADAGAGACHASPYLLSCMASNGVGEACLSDDPNQCAGSDQAMPGVVFTCHDRCGAHEYAVACGSIGSGPIGDPPAGCHDELSTPAGIGFYCCPCE